MEFNSLKDSYPDLQTMIAIGGWTHNEPGELQPRFGQVAATETSRQNFASSVVLFLRQYGFDGLDLDWEYPAASDRGGNPEDTQNYVLLCEELRKHFDAAQEDFLLTMATPIGSYASNYDIVGLADHLDWFNVMSYDIHGYWDNPQFVGFHTDMRDIKSYLAQYYSGVPSDKLVLGVGSYGRTYTLSSVSCNSPGCPFTDGGAATSCTDSLGYIGYFEIKDMIENGQYDKNEYDEGAGSMYLSYGSLWISYDDAYTFSIKRDYAESECMKGVMEWAMDMSQGDNPLLDNPVPSVPATSIPTKAPVSAPISSSPTESPIASPATPLPTKSPVDSPVTPVPTKTPEGSPTKAPVSSGGGDACCSYDNKNCDSNSTWCGANESRCSSCGGVWLPNGALTQCLAKYEACHNSNQDCCGSASCVGSEWWKQCQ